MAKLESELKLARKEGAATGEEARALGSQLRAKDKELSATHAKLDWAKQVRD